MSHLLEDPPKKHSFLQGDILGRLGDTICLVVDRKILMPPRPQPDASNPRPCEEEPERWDGLE